MKKTLVILLTVSLLAVLIVGCGQKNQSGDGQEATNTGDDGQELANPVVEVENAEQIMDELDIFITIPGNASDAKYSIIDNSIAQVDFLLNGAQYNHRIEKNEAFEDISGVYTEFETEKDMDWIGYEYHIAYNEGREGLSTWYDQLSAASYSVFMDSKATEEALKNISEALIPAG